MRLILVYSLVIAYVLLGSLDLWKHNYRLGIISILLAFVNGLIFWRS